MLLPYRKILLEVFETIVLIVYQYGHEKLPYIDAALEMLVEFIHASSDFTVMI